MSEDNRHPAASLPSAVSDSQVPESEGVGQGVALSSVEGYELVREIGIGGMATVYLGRDKQSGDEVAIKIMAPALQADRNFSDRFLKEARIMAELDHPNIAKILSVGTVGFSSYIVMEYLGGGEFKDRIRAGIVPTDALEVCCQVADALTYAHDRGYVHRDVKPENILFRDDGTPALSDFGIARAIQAGTRWTGTGMAIGTPHYMSPEQARGGEVDAAADFYALGVVLFEALAGRLPYSADDTYAVGLMHISSPIPTLDGELGRYQFIIDNLMAKSPVDRYSHVDQLRRACADVGRTRGRISRPKHATKNFQLSSSRRVAPPVVAWSLGGSAAAALLVASVWAFTPSQEPRIMGGGGGAALPALVQQLPERAAPPPLSFPQPRESVRESNSARIKVLVEDADRQVAESKWTTPAGDNAYDTIKEILEIDPTSQDARRLLGRMADRYGDLAQTAMDSGNLERAIALVGNGLKIDPVSERLTAIQTEALDKLSEEALGKLSEEEARVKASVAQLHQSLAENQRELERLEAQKAARSRELSDIANRIQSGQLTEQQLAELEERKRELEDEVRKLEREKQESGEQTKGRPKFIGSF